MRHVNSFVYLICFALILSFPTLFAYDSKFVSNNLPLRTHDMIPSGVSNGHVLINMTFVKPSDQAATAVIQLDDGSFVIGGFSGNALGDGLMLLGADVDGNYEWNETYSPGAALRRMIMCNDSGFALLGMIMPEGFGTDDWLVVRTNSSHGQQWNHTYGGQGYDYPSGIVELEDGFMLGGSYTNISGANLDYIMIRIDINGTPLWNVTFGNSEDQWCDQMIGCSDGSFLLCGYTWTPVNQWDIWIVKTDSSGNHLWNRTFSTSEYDRAHDVIELQDGGYVIAGGINDGNEGVLLLLRIDSEGNQVWNRTYARGADRTFDGYSVVETPDHGFCLRGRETYLITNDTFWLVRTDCSGNMLWEYALGLQTVRVYSIINAQGGGFVTAGTACEYGTEEWDFHLMLFPELDWVEEPANQLWFTNVVPIPTYQLNVTSAAPIQSWHVNDTNFNIDSHGLLTNTTFLNGTYNLRITVIDAVDNILMKDIMILATLKTLPTTTTVQSTFPLDVLVIGAIGSAAIIIVLVVLLKIKRG